MVLEGSPDFIEGTALSMLFRRMRALRTPQGLHLGRRCVHRFGRGISWERVLLSGGMQVCPELEMAVASLARFMPADYQREAAKRIIEVYEQSTLHRQAPAWCASRTPYSPRWLQTSRSSRGRSDFRRLE